MTQETEREAFERAFEQAWENDTTGWSGFAWHIWQVATAEAEARYAPKINALRGLLNRGLDLCAIGRNLDKQNRGSAAAPLRHALCVGNGKICRTTGAVGARCF